MNRPDPLELDGWNRANERARREYRQHPFERSLHGPGCGREGCRKGYAALVAQANRINDYRRDRRARGLAS
jgi:hypothetical protein